MRSATEMHGHLVEQVNLALRRLGVYGGEIALRLLFDHLVFLEECEPEWDREFAAFSDSGGRSSLGVRGAFQRLMPGDCHDGTISSVYAEFARQRGWLTLDRELTSHEYTEARDRLGAWCGEDRSWQDVTAEFGPASVLFGSTNPYYPKTLGYATGDPTEPMISFHLWNAAELDGEWPPSRPDLVLLAMRLGNVPFDERFTFTPEGLRRRPCED